MRIDKFLWFVRLAKTRGLAQDIVSTGHLRIDGRPIDRAHMAVRTGQVLGFVLGDRVRILRVLALPTRRGPASEARACYEDLSETGDAAKAENVSQQGALG